MEIDPLQNQNNLLPPLPQQEFSSWQPPEGQPVTHINLEVQALDQMFTIQKELPNPLANPGESSPSSSEPLADTATEQAGVAVDLSNGLERINSAEGYAVAGVIALGALGWARRRRSKREHKISVDEQRRKGPSALEGSTYGIRPALTQRARIAEAKRRYKAGELSEDEFEIEKIRIKATRHQGHRADVINNHVSNTRQNINTRVASGSIDRDQASHEEYLMRERIKSGNVAGLQGVERGAIKGRDYKKHSHRITLRKAKNKILPPYRNR